MSTEPTIVEAAMAARAAKHGRVEFKAGIPGFKCGDCDAVFTEDAADSSHGVDVSEAHGAREVRDVTTLACPDCGSEDLEDCEVCRKCREAEATDAGQCASCNPAKVALCDACGQRPGTRTVVAYGIETWACDPCIAGEPVRRDQVQPVAPLLQGESP